METNSNNNNIKNNNCPQNIEQKNKKIKKNQNKYIKFIKTNLYLNEYNYYFKNAIKMNKLREEKIKEHKQITDILRKQNILPKMLYCNKFLNNEIIKKNFKNFNTLANTISKSNISNSNKCITECKSSENRAYIHRKIEKAILAKNIEENNKSHIKKTIKAFDDLIKYIDNFKIQNKRPNLNLLLINSNNLQNESNILKEEDINGINEEEDLNVEIYNFDEYKKRYQNEQLSKKNSNSQIHLKAYGSQRELKNNFSEIFKNQNVNNDNIYITASNYLKTKKKNKAKENISSFNKITNTNEFSNSFDNKNRFNKKKEKINLKINSMTLISDDSLLNKIKSEGRDFKNGLYFNEYGKFKFTELGLNYPNSVDKYKKIPDYQGNDLEERKVFKYKSIITNPKYNYTNIGTFNEKFNHDLSDISTYYGKEYSKGRFLRNPLISKFSKYIPNYEQYKDLKFIENRYIVKNKYKFRLKPLINNKKNNFDKLASNVYKKEYKHEYFNNNK